MGKTNEALSTIEQAAMLNPNRWKVWSNYAQIAFDNKNMKKFVKAVSKIIELDKVK